MTKRKFRKGQVVRLLINRKLGEIAAIWKSYDDLYRVKIDGLDENLHGYRMRPLNNTECGRRNDRRR